MKTEHCTKMVADGRGGRMTAASLCLIFVPDVWDHICMRFLRSTDLVRCRLVSRDGQSSTDTAVRHHRGAQMTLPLVHLRLRVLGERQVSSAALQAEIGRMKTSARQAAFRTISELQALESPPMVQSAARMARAILVTLQPREGSYVAALQWPT